MVEPALSLLTPKVLDHRSIMDTGQLNYWSTVIITTPFSISLHLYNMIILFAT